MTQPTNGRLIKSLLFASPAVRRAVADIGIGKPIIIKDSQREGEADIAMAAQYCSPEWVNYFLRRAGGLLCIVCSPATAKRIGIARLPSNGLDALATPFATPISLRNCPFSAVSASGRSQTIVTASDPRSKAGDFETPGHVSTLISHPQGIVGRYGHTESVVELLSFLGDEVGVLCEILDQKGEVAELEAADEFAREENLHVVDIADIKEAVLGSREEHAMDAPQREHT